ncbi:MAG: glycosyltransferase, partial [Anaerolineales bacterium]
RGYGVRVISTENRGLSSARNTCLAAASGEIIAYTDDDVIVDPGWIGALARVFAADPDVMAVTGLVMPAALDTPAQVLFEKYGGFGRGYVRWWYAAEDPGPLGMRFGGAGRFGTGANMAYRRTVFDRIGPFDPALDVGTVTNGGGDLEMFFRVLKTGYTLVYEPAAIVFHRHRETYAELRRQLADNGTGFFSYLVRAWLHTPDERLSLLRLGVWWLWWWNLRRLLRSYLGLEEFPRDLILAELKGSLIGLGRYPRARRIAAGIARAHPSPILAPERSGDPA